MKCSLELELWWIALKYCSSVPDTHWGTTSTFCFSPWALPIHPVLLPVSGVSDAVLKPYALLNSSRILPSRPIPAALCWPWTLGCHEEGLPASCVGSKYLHSPLSQVVRRRGLHVLGYVKSNPPGRTFNWLSLLEQICEQIYLRESFLILLIQSQKQTTYLCILLIKVKVFAFLKLFIHLTKILHHILNERDDIVREKLTRNSSIYCAT